MQNAKCKMQNAKCKMQNAKCKMQKAKCKILICLEFFHCFEIIMNFTTIAINTIIVQLIIST